jgi:hypothetical protein
MGDRRVAYRVLFGRSLRRSRRRVEDNTQIDLLTGMGMHGMD